MRLVSMWTPAVVMCCSSFSPNIDTSLQHQTTKTDRLHFISFGDGSGVSDITVKEQNDKMLASVAGATRGTVMPAQTVVDLMGESTIKTTNPILVRSGHSTALASFWRSSQY